MRYPNVRDNSFEHIDATAWVVSGSSGPADYDAPSAVVVPVSGGGGTETITAFLDVNGDSILDAPLTNQSQFPYAGRSGETLTNLWYRAIDAAGHVTTCATTVTVKDCKGFASSVGCDEPGGAQLRTPAAMQMSGRVGRDAFRDAVLATLAAADPNANVEVVVSLYVQTVQHAVTMPGTAATFAPDTDSGMEARLQFRTGVAATLNITADAITITSVSDGSGAGRRLQSGGVTVDYTATAEDDVAGTLDQSDFTSELVDNINDAGDSLDLSSSDVSSGSATVETEIVFEVSGHDIAGIWVHSSKSASNIVADRSPPK